jgi:L-threonylcarbamoyladenylate synthase
MSVDRAASLLRAGALVVFPTETVYCLGADAADDDAVEALFAVKERPRTSPIIANVNELTAARLVELNAEAERLAAAFWPGPLTLVLPRRRDAHAARALSAGLATLAVRVSSHPVARALHAAFGDAIAATSANRSGFLSATTAEEARRQLGDRAALILDDGASPLGIESTVVDLSRPEEPIVVRRGAVPCERIAEALGRELVILSSQGSGRRRSRSSAIERPVRMNVTHRADGAAYLGFGPTPGATRNLSAVGDLDEAAKNLYAFLLAVDRPPFLAIDIAPIPDHGIGAAINDRLRHLVVPL